MAKGRLVCNPFWSTTNKPDSDQTPLPFRALRSTETSREILVEAIIQLPETGTTPWRREWDSTGGGHHVNLLSGHRYRWANPILLCLGIHLRGSALPYWCGFAEAWALGIFPRAGN